MYKINIDDVQVCDKYDIFSKCGLILLDLKKVQMNNK